MPMGRYPRQMGQPAFNPSLKIIDLTVDEVGVMRFSLNSLDQSSCFELRPTRILF